eukprot:m.84328 g.84328  ORF g.84328 m.84328 type:complete len:53 (+) comp14384_c0_seq1:56-214(+)
MRKFEQGCFLLRRVAQKETTWSCFIIDNNAADLSNISFPSHVQLFSATHRLK